MDSLGVYGLGVLGAPFCTQMGIVDEDQDPLALHVKNRKSYDSHETPILLCILASVRREAMMSGFIVIAISATAKIRRITSMSRLFISFF